MVSNACSRFLATARISPCVVAQGTCFDRKKDDWKGKMQEWSGKRDSNPQPSAWKADALAVELFPQRASLILSRHRWCTTTVVPDSCLSPTVKRFLCTVSTVVEMVEGGGFEPPKSYDDRFTVCSLWPLGNPSTLSCKRCWLARFSVWRGLVRLCFRCPAAPFGFRFREAFVSSKDVFTENRPLWQALFCIFSIFFR